MVGCILNNARKHSTKVARRTLMHMIPNFLNTHLESTKACFRGAKRYLYRRSTGTTNLEHKSFNIF